MGTVCARGESRAQLGVIVITITASTFPQAPEEKHSDQIESAYRLPNTMSAETEVGEQSERPLAPKNLEILALQGGRDSDKFLCLTGVHWPPAVWMALPCLPKKQQSEAAGQSLSKSSSSQEAQRGLVLGYGSCCGILYSSEKEPPLYALTWDLTDATWRKSR